MDNAFVWSQVYWPHKVDKQSVDNLLRHIASNGNNIGQLIFEARGRKQSLCYYFGAFKQDTPYLNKLLQTSIQGVVIVSTNHSYAISMAKKVQFMALPARIKTDNQQHITESILTALSEAGENEEILLQISLGRRHEPHLIPVKNSPLINLQSFCHALLNLDFAKTKATPRDWKAKLSDYSFSCTLRIGIKAASKSRCETLCNKVIGALRVAQTPEVTFNFKRDNPIALTEIINPLIWPLRLTISELTGLLAWPLGDKHYPGLDRSGARLLQACSQTTVNERIIAYSTAPATKDNPIGLRIPDALHHLHVMGPTGVGKSTLLLNLITQDIQDGHSVIVIDPKGDLNNEVMARIPQSRKDDVVILNPSYEDRVVGFNPLHGTGQSPDLVVDHLLTVFHGLYQNSWGPRTQDIMHASLLTLATNQNTTLCDLPALLTNASERSRLIAGLNDPIALGPFWEWYEQLSQAERSQAIAPVMNKLRAFLLRPRMRAILGQQNPTFHMNDLFNSKKILLVTLAKGTFGTEGSALLGSLVLAQFWQAALGRVEVPVTRRHPVTLYADEFQDYLYLPTDLSDVLATSRSLGVAMTLAHQHLAQLPVNMRAAVLANARSRVLFQLAYEDAYKLAQSTPLLKTQDFMNLKRYEVYASLMANGSVTQFASGKTAPPIPPINDQADIVRLSLQNYGQSPDSILQTIPQRPIPLRTYSIGRTYKQGRTDAQ